MARESQGIQIALIIFVMLAIVLGVTTYLYVQRNGEVIKAQKDAQATADKAKAEVAAKEAEIADLKKMIGESDKSTADIHTAFDEDMKKYAANFPEDARVYHTILERLGTTISQQASDFKKTAKDLTDLQNQFQLREARTEKIAAAFNGNLAEFKTNLATVTQDYTTQQTKVKDEQDVLVKQMVGFKDAVNKAKAVATQQASESRAAIEKLNGEVRSVTKTLDQVTHQTMDTPSGEITYVSQRTGTVWINRGRADHLQRQTKFGVYSGEGEGMSKVKKGEVEVVRILEDHSAEARIISDSISNPILPYDKVYTPLWSPGSQMHFALAGIMDIDGDGHNSVNTVRSLITSNGAVVDSYMDAEGNVVGNIDVGTRTLVIGDAPSSKSSPKLLKAYGDMISKADRVSASRITLADLKEKMGYKKSSSVESFGNSADQGDVTKAAAAVKKNKAAAKAPASDEGSGDK
jgi:hypothetical protein